MTWVDSEWRFGAKTFSKILKNRKVVKVDIFQHIPGKLNKFLKGFFAEYLL